MQFIDTATLSLANLSAVKPVEIYVPLWLANGTIAGNTVTSSTDPALLRDGSTGGMNASSSLADSRLFTLSSKWPANLKFAMEVTFYAQSGSTANMELWDITASSAVSSSSVSTTNTTASVIRSAQFSLIPGHVYGVGWWNSTATYMTYITDASLIVFP